jgi:hypothetical protein
MAREPSAIMHLVPLHVNPDVEGHIPKNAFPACGLIWLIGRSFTSGSVDIVGLGAGGIEGSYSSGFALTLVGLLSTVGRPGFGSLGPVAIIRFCVSPHTLTLILMSASAPDGPCFSR